MNAKLVIPLGILAAIIALPTAFAAAGDSCTGAEDCEALSKGTSNMGLAIGAGLAIGLAGLGTGLAQRDIGAAAVGATAENEGFLGKSLIYVAIPETIVILGFVIAFFLYTKIA